MRDAGPFLSRRRCRQPPCQKHARLVIPPSLKARRAAQQDGAGPAWFRAHIPPTTNSTACNAPRPDGESWSPSALRAAKLAVEAAMDSCAPLKGPNQGRDQRRPAWNPLWSKLFVRRSEITLSKTDPRQVQIVIETRWPCSQTGSPLHTAQRNGWESAEAIRRG